MAAPDGEVQPADAPAPASWKLFGSVGEYEAFMDDPSRVVKLEWRKVRRQRHWGLTSHSWLEAYLLDGRRMRLEFFSDSGLVESIYDAGDLELLESDEWADSVVYGGRAAAAHEFARPLTVDRLRSVATDIALRPYSVDNSNCHHFVLDVWNRVVISILQQSHYPDRVKTGFLRGAVASLGKLWLGSVGASLGSEPAATSAPRVSRGGHAHPTLSLRHEEGSRVSGGLSALGRGAPGYNRAVRLERFAEALKTDAVHLLQSGHPLAVAGLPPQKAPATWEAWADAWLPGVGDDALRVAERIGTTDVIDLLTRILSPQGFAGDARRGGAGLGSLGSEGAMLASLSSRAAPFPSSLSAGREHGPAVDVCYLALRSGVEVRLAIYAILCPASAMGKMRRLRLLSGDARAGKEGTFQYTLCDLPGEAPPMSAVELARTEVEALQMAMCTGEWGFVTLL